MKNYAARVASWQAMRAYVLTLPPLQVNKYPVWEGQVGWRFNRAPKRSRHSLRPRPRNTCA